MDQYMHMHTKDSLMTTGVYYLWSLLYTYKPEDGMGLCQWEGA